MKKLVVVVVFAVTACSLGSAAKSSLQALQVERARALEQALTVR